MWYKLLNGGIGTTAENLLEAANGENYEWTDMYETFAKEAREDGVTYQHFLLISFCLLRQMETMA